jgi:anthranilate phosphoribosyltransferase
VIGGFVQQLLRGETLDREQARALMELLMDGQVPPVTTAAVLAALRVRGETVDEITGFAEGMRSRSTTVPLKRTDAIDTCGTGGDGSGTFNISTATAFVAAGAGAAVAKHGNRAVSSRSGSADVLEALGVPITQSPEAAGHLVDTIGLGFLFAPNHHPAMRHVMPVRRELAARTVFNVLGPLTNPAGVKRQVLGVFDEALCEPLAHVLGALGSTHAYVVHGRDGCDEVSLVAETTVAELRDGEVVMSSVAPEDFGLTRCRPEDLAGGDPEHNAGLIRAILANQPGPGTDAVLINAAFAVTVAGLVETPADGLVLVRGALADGGPRRVLESLQNIPSEEDNS